MKPFAAPGFRVWNLPLPAKVLYSAFSVLTLFGILSSALYYGALVGGSGFAGSGFAGVRSYYAGEVTEAPVEEPAVAVGPKIELPPEESRRPMVVATTYRKLLEVTHFHLFTMPVVLLIVGHLFFATGIRERAKLLWISAASASVAIHIATPWLVRYGGGVWAPLHTISGAFMGTCMTVITGYPVLMMWFPPRGDGPNAQRPPPPGTT